MLDRTALKTAAKLRMTRPGFRLIWYTLFLMIAANAASVVVRLRLPSVYFDPLQFDSLEGLEEFIEETYANIEIPVVAMVVLLVYQVFVSVIQIGYRRTCLMVSRGEEVAFRDMFDAFGYWLKVIGLELLIGIVTAAGTMLFIVPGIILSYSYSQAFFILIDNPDIGIIEAMRCSRAMMRGHKIEFFVFQLSYFPWYLLSSFIALADLYVTPYVTVGEALYYEYVAGHQVFVFKSRFDTQNGEETDTSERGDGDL